MYNSAGAGMVKPGPAGSKKIGLKALNIIYLNQAYLYGISNPVNFFWCGKVNRPDKTTEKTGITKMVINLLSY